MLGVFAAMDIFVEEAIPTTLHLICEELVEEKDLEAKSKTLWGNPAREEVEEKYEKSKRTNFTRYYSFSFINSIYSVWSNIFY